MEMNQIVKPLLLKFQTFKISVLYLIASTPYNEFYAQRANLNVLQITLLTTKISHNEQFHFGSR